jgi:hypothetical protein
MATRDQMIAEALKDLGSKLDRFMKEVNDFKVEVAANREFSSFKEKYADEMATVKTQVKIYAGIAGGLGMIVGGIVVGAIAKLVVR